MPLGKRILLWIDPFPMPGNEARRTERVQCGELLVALRRWGVAAMVLFVGTEAIDSSLVVVQAVLAFSSCIAIAVCAVIGAVYVMLGASR